MSSSLVPPPVGQLPGTASLVQVLKLVPDPRARRGYLHALPRFVAAALAAVVAGARAAATTALHLVSAADHATGTLLGQLATAAKRPVKKGVPRILGFADNDRMIVAVQRGRPPTVGPRRPERPPDHPEEAVNAGPST